MFVLEVTDPEGGSLRAEIGGNEITLGRHTTCDLQLPRANVSKRHAKLMRRDDMITVVDLGSTNGTYLNRCKITFEVRVHERDTIYIGDYRIAVYRSDLEPTIERPLPPYLARDPVEHRLLTELAEHGEAARVVYADWLEGRGELERAEFLRTQQEFVEGSPDEPRCGQLTGRLRELAASIDPPWRARVARAPVERCSVAFKFECPKEWGKLEPTDRDGVRYCGSCKKTVHYALTIGDARRYARRGNCVAIDVAATRWAQDLAPPYGRYVCPSCDLDVGPSVVECPRCGAEIRRTTTLMGAIAWP